MTAGQNVDEWNRGVIAQSLHCRRCGYDLRGLAPTGKCPECATDIWETILVTVDPAASRLPALRNPRRVGDGLVLLTVCIFIAGLGYLLRPGALWVDSLRLFGQVRLSEWTRPGLPMASGLIGLIGLLGVVMVAPPPGKEPSGPVWRDIWLLALGLAVWSLLVCLQGWLELVRVDRSIQLLVQFLTCPAAIVGLIGLQGIMRVIGLRSREYRTSRGGRQSAQAMIAAFVFNGLGTLMLLIAEAWMRDSGIEAIATLVVRVSQVMLLIGAGYLVLNAIWIRRALRRPPPPLESLLTFKET
jgi:hypothetical protein